MKKTVIKKYLTLVGYCYHNTYKPNILFNISFIRGVTEIVLLGADVRDGWVFRRLMVEWPVVRLGECLFWSNCYSSV